MQAWTHEELTSQIITLSLKGMSRRAVARSLGISRNTVRKAIETHRQGRESSHCALPAPAAPAPRPPGIADGYTDQIVELLAKYPDITAQRVFEEVREAGYPGSYGAIKVRVRKLRLPAKRRPSLETPVTGPGKMAESDWSPYKVDLEGGGRLNVQAFSYVLRFSHRKYYGFFERCDLHALMDGHEATFARFGGAAEVCKYDSQKPVVLGWEGEQPIYNPRFLAFATHYEFRPEACRRFHPNDKPRVERGFWELERSFFCGRAFRDFADLRLQLGIWLDGTCDRRRHDKTKRTALEAFAEERAHLRPLPAHPYDTARVFYRVASIDGFVSFDGNRYAVPYDHVTDILPIRVTQNEIFIYAADLRLLARLELAGRGQGVDVAPPGCHDHAASTRRHTDLDQLGQTFAELGEEGALFFAGLKSAQGRQAGFHARLILVLRERFSTADLGAALRHARAFGAFEHQAVERILSAKAAPRRLAEYVDEDFARRLAESVGDRDVPVRDLDEYDQLPTIASAKEATPCQQDDPQEQTTSSTDSDDTSNS
jgi:transposase